jgi:hypothetical protein
MLAQQVDAVYAIVYVLIIRPSLADVLTACVGRLVQPTVGVDSRPFPSVVANVPRRHDGLKSWEESLDPHCSCCFRSPSKKII